MNSKHRSNSIIISPSGNLYGSEKVLLDFLKNTSNNYKVYVPKNSKIQHEIKNLRHTISSFSSLWLLYLRIFFKLLVGVDCLYVNEGGHIKYIKILAKLLPHKKFIIHVRILEDTYSSRIGKITKNIQFIAVSNFIKQQLNRYEKVSLIYDSFPLDEYKRIERIVNTGQINFGIIGRVTPTKGLNDILEFLKYLDDKKENFIFNFYGTIEDDKQEVKEFLSSLKDLKHITCRMHGFVQNSKSIYEQCDMVLHFNKNEPLGRICFESWGLGIPFISFDAGGIGELSRALGAEDYLVNTGSDWKEEMFNKIKNTLEVYPLIKIEHIRKKIQEDFSVLSYVHSIENLIGQ